ncbi:MAG: hypothetical protein CMJ83_12450 [Planctomycetes bacterium]|nr:hypothetical protein [Planctomycetota bacterium]
MRKGTPARRGDRSVTAPLRTPLLTLAAAVLLAALVADRTGLPFPRAAAVTLIALLGVMVLGRFLGLDARGRRRRRFLGFRLRDLDRLSGIEFEDWIAHVLERAGFRVTRTPRSGDFGVDLVAVRDGHRVGIEAKRRSSPVSNDVVRSVVAGCQYHRCDRAAVVTQSSFTRTAHRQATGADPEVVLIGRDDLDRLPELLIP